MGILREFIENENQIMDAALAMMVSELGNHGDEDMIRNEWRIENGHSPYGDDNDDEIEQNYDDFAQEWCEDRLWSVMSNLSYLFGKEKALRVYRVITAPKDWKPDGRHPGIYWSWNKDAADAHWGSYENGDVAWRMEANITFDVVDWLITLMMNALPSYESEQEIRILKDTPIDIISIERAK